MSPKTTGQGQISSRSVSHEVRKLGQINVKCNIRGFSQKSVSDQTGVFHKSRHPNLTCKNETLNPVTHNVFHTFHATRSVHPINNIQILTSAAAEFRTEAVKADCSAGLNCDFRYSGSINSRDQAQSIRGSDNHADVTSLIINIFQEHNKTLTDL